MWMYGHYSDGRIGSGREDMIETTGVVPLRRRQRSAANDSAGYRDQRCRRLPTSPVERVCPHPLYRLLPISPTGHEEQQFPLNGPIGNQIEALEGDQMTLDIPLKRWKEIR